MTPTWELFCATCGSAFHHELELTAVHLLGVTNHVLDYLSHWHLDSTTYSRLFALECVDASNFIEETVTEDFFILNSDLQLVFLYRC